MEKVLTRNFRPGEPMGLAEYEAAGGYQSLRKALQHTPQELQEMVTRANLRGRGGAGFNTGQKWSFVPMGDGVRRPKYFVVNADEMEPGTMKDRFLMEGDPHQLLEGVIISSYAIGADVAFIFLRNEYRRCERLLARAIAEAHEKHYIGRRVLGTHHRPDVRLHLSAGRYMCGEEEGLLGALEGKRAIPRPKPPFPATCGLWGRPTNVNNVETVCCVPHIVERGPEGFKALSLSSDGGTKIYGCSGRVKRPGLWELPMGTPAREILHEHAGGMREGYEFRALLPGGGSTNFLLEEHLDVKMDFSAVETVGSRLGTGTMIVMDHRTCPVGMMFSLEDFFARESCGWCTPCREGLPWIARILRALERGDGQAGDLEMLDFHVRMLKPGHTFCALAPGAIMPLQGAMKYFRGDFQRHIDERRCPWR